MIKKIKGSSLLAALMFTFVLMVIISALAYNFRMDSLAISTLVDEKQNINLDEGHFANIIGEVDLSETTSEDIGDFRFTTTPNSIAPEFEYENTNAELYNADPYLISFNVKHEFYDNGILKYIRNFIYNTLPSSRFTQHSEDVFPLNIPYANTDAMTGNLSSYRLSSEEKILDKEQGYLGYIEKEDSSLDVHTSSLNSAISVPDDLSINYKLNIGWDLKQGYWSVFLVIYDDNKVYTSSTTLRNLFDNIAQAETDLSNWQAVVDLPGGNESSDYPTYVAGTKYENGDVVASGENLYSCKIAGWCSSSAEWAYGPGTGSAWQSAWDLDGAIDDEDGESSDGSIVLAKWFNNSNNEEPKLLILRKTSRSSNFDLDVYKTAYDSINKLFIASLADTYTTGLVDFDESNVHVVIPDALFTLDSSVPLIFQGANIFDFNAEGTYLLGDGTGSTRGTLIEEVANKPVIIKKNSTQLYIVYFNGSSYYKYLYSFGVAVPTLVSSRIFSGEQIQSLIVKFGALFIVTDSNIYMENMSDGSLISVIPASGSEYQIFRDGEGQIYAIADGLSCTISSNCSDDSRVYFDSGCSVYGGCDILDDFNDVSPYLNMVYKSFEF